MADVPGPAHSLATTLHDLLAENHDLHGLLDELARLTAEHFLTEEDVHCGIILRRDKKSIVVAASSSMAEQMDEIQAGFDNGPCLEALRIGTVIRVADVRAEQRWTPYMDVVRERGLASVLAVPLMLGEAAEAAMNFYTRHPRVFSDEDIADATMYVELIAKGLRIALRIADHADVAFHRQAAMESRTAIDLAVGIIMAQNRCGQDEAFAILRQASSHRNAKIRDLAAWPHSGRVNPPRRSTGSRGDPSRWPAAAESSDRCGTGACPPSAPTPRTAAPSSPSS